jgi:hypothetical protein
MPPQKQQELVSTSVAIVRNSSTTKPNGNCTSNMECSQKEIEPLTHDKVFEVVYSVRDNYIVSKTEKQEKQGGFFVDAQEKLSKTDRIVEKQGGFIVDKPERLSKTEKIVDKQGVNFFVDTQERPAKTEKIEKQGMCFVVDAHERRVRIVGKDEMRKQV